MHSGNALITENYNDLFPVFEADGRLEDHGRKAALLELNNVIARHGLEASLGIRLLHKHNDIEAGELMVENIQFSSSGEFMLVTEPKLAADSESTWAPNSWKLVSGNFVPMEFSSPHLLADTTISPDSQRECFEEFASTLCKLNLQNILGPAINVSDSVESQRPKGDTILSEITDDEHRRNIVMFVNQCDVDESKTIQTAWRASADADDVTKSCTTKCVRICPSVQAGHQGTYQHNRPHN